MTRVAVAGSSGFVGSAVVRALRDLGHEPVPLPSLRLDHRTLPPIRPPGTGTEAAAARWRELEPMTWEALVAVLGSTDAAVNAAGAAEPGSADLPNLLAANAILPALLLAAAAEARTRRLVHVSSAAVQGRRDPLDETEETEPFSAYSRSKSAGERAVLHPTSPASRAVQTVVYRPTSVQGPGRAMTAQLVRLASLPVAPTMGRGGAPLPLAHVDNVGFVAASLAVHPTAPPPIVLHPNEGVTTADVYALLGGRTRTVPLPRPVVRAAIGAARAGGRRSSSLDAIVRRLELLLVGQGCDARALTDLGIALPLDPDAFGQLAGATPTP